MLDLSSELVSNLGLKLMLILGVIYFMPICDAVMSGEKLMFGPFRFFRSYIKYFPRSFRQTTSTEIISIFLILLLQMYLCLLIVADFFVLDTSYSKFHLIFITYVLVKSLKLLNLFFNFKDQTSLNFHRFFVDQLLALGAFFLLMASTFVSLESNKVLLENFPYGLTGVFLAAKEPILFLSYSYFIVLDLKIGFARPSFGQEFNLTNQRKKGGVFSIFDKVAYKLQFIFWSLFIVQVFFPVKVIGTNNSNIDLLLAMLLVIFLCTIVYLILITFFRFYPISNTRFLRTVAWKYQYILTIVSLVYSYWSKWKI